MILIVVMVTMVIIIRGVFINRPARKVFNVNEGLHPSPLLPTYINPTISEKCERLIIKTNINARQLDV